MSDGNGPTTPIHLGWTNVGLGFAFILFDVVLSSSFGLGIERSLFTAAVRCVVQLSVVGVLLQQVFETKDPWAVGGIALLLNLLGTFEITGLVANKSKRRYDYMLPSVLIGLLGSTIPISIIGTKVAMSIEPFWEPVQYIPIVGMLCGNTISGILVCVSFVLRELQENRDKIEIYLAFGATRMEACKSIAREALRLALTPLINQMSVIGIIAIPGMMTGAILGGASVQQAARLQMIIMFMIAASTALASIFTTISVISITIDGEHRIRTDRIDESMFWMWRAPERVLCKIMGFFKGVFRLSVKEKGYKTFSDERTPLLAGESCG
ncbi:hypothetical protein DXG03_009020 [Asterophora parasitica]|uniref:Uncharacterized protein n=1 Tax=Asterophora parasitica TaxID=117018 RepID=A0A9P7G773_9AGAR|nr:hypothetical protein DXG03_009020 [Asterophora parasitica]